MIENLSSSDYERLRARARRDLYFFAKGVLGYKDLVPRVHKPLCDFITAPGLRKLALMPRGHFKTTVCTIADTIRLLTVDQNLRILLANESAMNAELMLAEIKRHFENNPRLQGFFPEIVPPNFSNTVWSRNALLIPRTAPHREPSVSAVGVGSAVVSRHFNVMKFDDLVSEEAAYSPTVMSKAIDWLNHSVSLLVSPREDELHIIGTRWSFNDVYSHAMDNMGFDVFRRKAVVLGPDGPEPLFKERFDMRFFEDIIRTDPEQWANQYANDPLDVALTDFQKQWLRYYTIAPDLDLRWTDARGVMHKQEISKLRIYTHVDPSMGESLSSDYSAVVTVGLNSRGEIFVLDAWRRRVDPLQLVEKIFEVHNYFSPKLISIEAVAFQKALQYFIEEEARRRMTYLRIEPTRPSTRKSKEARIRGALQPYFNTGMVFINAGMTDLVEEYLHFGRAKHEDLMDALAQGPEFWRSPADDEQLERHQRQVKQLMDAGEGVTGYGI